MALTNVTIASGVITIGSQTFNTDDLAAMTNKTIVVIVTKSNMNYRIFEAKNSDLKLNGTAYGTAALFCAAFNALTSQAQRKNTDYPDTLISSVITASTKQQIASQAKPGYVTLTAPDVNTGVIYIGLTGVANTNYALAAGKSVPLELADLSLIWVLASVAGEKVHVLGGYKN